MASKETLLKELDWVTEKISSLVWILNLGTLGTTWSLLIASSTPDQLKFTFYEARWIFLLCLTALLCEMGQYLSTYVMSRSILRDLENRDATEFTYDPRWLTYRLRKTLFFLKIFATVAASLFLLVTIFRKLG